MPLSFSCGCATLSCYRSFRACILHSFRPVHFLRAITHVNNRFGADKVDVMHLMAGGTQDHQVLDGIVVAVAIDMCNFEHHRNAETTMGTHGIVVLESKLAITDAATI